jgi:hypothetical protein
VSRALEMDFQPLHQTSYIACGACIHDLLPFRLTWELYIARVTRRRVASQPIFLAPEAGQKSHSREPKQLCDKAKRGHHLPVLAATKV